MNKVNEGSFNLFGNNLIEKAAERNMTFFGGHEMDGPHLGTHVFYVYRLLGLQGRIMHACGWTLNV